MLQTLSYSNKDENNNYHQNQNNIKMNNSINANVTSSNTNETGVSNNPVAKKSPLDQLISNLKNNPNYLKEITLGKIIGFYRIGSEIGTGNFSQVKLGLHLLTKGRFAAFFSNIFY